MKPSANVNQKLTDSASPARNPGRPRSAHARRKVLRAAREILEEEGLVAVTIEKVAARSKVGKPTIYRTWPNALSVAMAALLETPTREAAAEPPIAQTAIARLEQHVRQTALIFANRTGRQVAMLLAAADESSELAKVFRNHFLEDCRNQGRKLLEEALAAGEIQPGVDPEIALDLLFAPVFYRLLFRPTTLDAAFAEQVCALAMQGLRR